METAIEPSIFAWEGTVGLMDAGPDLVNELAGRGFQCTKDAEKLLGQLNTFQGEGMIPVKIVTPRLLGFGGQEKPGSPTRGDVYAEAVSRGLKPCCGPMAAFFLMEHGSVFEILHFITDPINGQLFFSEQNVLACYDENLSKRRSLDSHWVFQA